MSFSSCPITLSICALLVLKTMVYRNTPFTSDSDAVMLSIFKCLRVKMIVTLFIIPMLFSVKTDTVYVFSIFFSLNVLLKLRRRWSSLGKHFLPWQPSLPISKIRCDSAYLIMILLNLFALQLSWLQCYTLWKALQNLDLSYP